MEPLRVKITSEPERLSSVREALQEWLAAQGWADDQVCELVLALDEALTNVIRHGYNSRPGQPIEVTVAVTRDDDAGDGVEIRVRDFGRQVEPTDICGRDLDDVRPGGLGVHIIRSMTSHAEYQQADGGGMLLIMRKHKSHRAAKPDCQEPA